MTDPFSGDRLRPRITQHSYIQLRALAEALRTEAARCGPGRVLDLGCGARPYASLFGHRYLGVDVSALHGAPDCVAMAERLPVRDASIETVLSTQHLEHADDPDAVLAEARRVLAPGGRVLLSTHGVWVYHPDPHDYWRWTEEGLRKLFDRNGFVVETVHHQGELYAAGLLLASYPLAGVRRFSDGLPKVLAGAVIAAVNVVALALDGLATSLFPRHYASASYLVAGRREA